MSLEDLVERALTEKARDMSAVPDVEALIARGLQARRRRRLAIAASMVAAVVVGAVAVGPMLWHTAGTPVSGMPSPPASVEATATVGPGRGTGFFGGSVPEVPVRFTMPAGWEAHDRVFVSKSDADPIFGLVFMDVGNIYAEGCKWVPLDPPPGPTVDDLVSAYAKLPGFGEPARDVTLDGFHGKQIQYTVPDYNEGECLGDGFGIFQEDHTSGVAPTLVAQTSKQHNRLWILDVDGTRLVILAGGPQNMSAQDRTDLDGILSSIQIG